jgi:ribosome biogenesis GTPase
MELTGTVVRLHGHHAYVDTGGQTYRCPLRGKLKKGPRRDRSPVCVGDRVSISPITGDGEPEAALESVHDRKGQLYRSHPRDARMRQLLAVNVDALLVVAGADRLDEQLLTLDRLLATAVLQSLDAVIAINKSDLAPPARIAATMQPYAAMKLPIHHVCATRSELGSLKNLFNGRTVVIAGQSGVGKSSLINALEPGTGQHIGEVDRVGEGRHTTTNASLLRIAGGYVVDTPGVRDFGFYDLKPEELSLAWPDFARARTQCKYSTCTHRHEPKCGVQAAVKSGEIDAGRYQRYLQILREEWNLEQSLAP